LRTQTVDSCVKLACPIHIPRAHMQWFKLHLYVMMQSGMFSAAPWALTCPDLD